MYVRLVEPNVGPDRDVPAPDVNTNSKMMDWFADEYSKIQGKDIEVLLQARLWKSAAAKDAGKLRRRVAYIFWMNMRARLEWSQKRRE